MIHFRKLLSTRSIKTAILPTLLTGLLTFPALLTTMSTGHGFFPDGLAGGSELAAQGNGYITVYPRKKSISTTTPLHMSLFTRGGSRAAVYLAPITRAEYQKYTIDPWSREYARVTSGIQFRKTSARFTKVYNVADGANYVTVNHGLAAGYYLIAAELDGKVRAFSTVLISNLGVVAKQSESGLLIYTVNLKSGRPMLSVPVTVSSPGVKRVRKLKTNSRGTALLDLKRSGLNPDKINIVARVDNQEAQLYSGRTPYQDSRYQVFIDTDRPVYKPGHEVNWFAVVREKTRSGMRPVTRTRAAFAVLSAGGKTISKGTGSLDKFGKLSGKLKVPSGAGGFFTIMVRVNGENHQANVLVKDYVKPKMVVRVLPDARAVIHGSAITGKIKAKYLHGAIPVGARVEYKVFAGLYKKPGFSISSEERFFDIARRTGGSGKGELVSNGTGTLDDSGEMSFNIETETKVTGSQRRNSVFSIRVTVVDGGGPGNGAQERGYGGTSVRVLEGAIILSARQQSFIVAPGQTEEIKLRVLDLKDKPVAGKTVEATLHREVWDSKSGYGGKNAEIKYEKVGSTSAQTGEDGIALLKLKFPGNGRFRVIARAKDDRGNILRESMYYWAADAEFKAAGGRFPELDLKADKRFYRPGETARILVTSSVADAPTLLTTEADHIYNHRVVRLRGNSYLVELPLKNAGYLPNIYFTALLVHKGRLISSSLPIFVSPQNRFIKLAVKPDKSRYRPGNRVKLDLKATDADGRGVKSSVAVAVVDEAVFLVQGRLAPSIQKFFYGRRPNRTRLSYSFPLIFTGGAAKDDNFDATVDRSKFKDTAYFKANVETDSRGRGSVVFNLPDNLTTWRVTGTVVDGGGRVGSSIKKFISTKEMTARLAVPRYLNTGSTGRASGIVRNLTRKPMTVIAQFRGRGGLRLGKPGEPSSGFAQSKTFRAVVQPGRRVSFSVSVFSRVENRNAKIQFFARTTDGRFRDSLEKKLPVYETGLTHTLASKDGLLHGKGPAGSKLLRLDDKILRLGKDKLKPVKYEVVVYPNLMGSVLGSLEYLLEYPHGCVEQTTSRFLPNIEVLRFLKENNIRNRNLEDKLRRNIQGGIRNLQELQNPTRGGWGWWRSRGGYAVNHWMTAYALYGLVTAKNAGFAVDAKKLKQGLDALYKIMYATGGHRTGDLDERDYPVKESFVVFANYILTAAGRGEPSITDAVTVLKQRSNLEALGWAARSLVTERRWKDLAELRRVILLQAVDFGFLQKSAQGPNSSQAYYTAIALGGVFAGARWSREDSIEFIKTLLAKRSADGKFISTRETAASILTMLNFLRTNKQYMRPSMEVTLQLPDGKTRKLQLSPSSSIFKPVVVPIALSGFNPADAKVKVQWRGTGLAQVYLRAKVFERTREFKARNNGITVERKYVPEGADPNRVKFSGVLSQGDAIDVIIKVKIASGGNYLAVTEHIPAGFTLASSFDYSSGRTNVVIKKDKIYFYVENYNGRETIRYRLRAVNPGHYLVQPARAELMYQDTINGSSRAEVLKVN